MLFRFTEPKLNPRNRCSSRARIRSRPRGMGALIIERNRRTLPRTSNQSGDQSWWTPHTSDSTPQPVSLRRSPSRNRDSLWRYWRRSRNQLADRGTRRGKSPLSVVSRRWSDTFSVFPESLRGCGFFGFLTRRCATQFLDLWLPGTSSDVRAFSLSNLPAPWRFPPEPPAGGLIPANRSIQIQREKGIGEPHLDSAIHIMKAREPTHERKHRPCHLSASARVSCLLGWGKPSRLRSRVHWEVYPGYPA
jgi:hypothetical protein